MPVEYFKSKEAYRKNMAYRHMHDIPFTAKEVVIAGKEHKVKHSGRAVDDKSSKAYKEYKKKHDESAKGTHPKLERPKVNHH